MSDTLDRLEQQARDAYATRRRPASPSKVLALVAVARAAERTVAEAGKYSKDGIPVSPVCRALYDALAALDAPKEKS